jgi:hypothetical protein
MGDARLTREEVAKIELGRTEVHPIVARVLLGVFLVTAALPACVQALADLARKRAASTPSTVSVSAPLAVIGKLQQVRSVADLLILVPTAHQIRAFEENLEDTSLVSLTLTPWVGWVIKPAARRRRAGVLRRQCWLFYRASVDSVTGQASSPSSGSACVTPTSRAAPSLTRSSLLQFHRQLAERGIVLVVMPVPGKESIYSERLASPQTSGEVIQNPSFEAFKAELSAAGVLVFDPASILAHLKHETPAYLMTDTHWSPAAVQRVAAGLAAWLAEKNLLPPTASASPRYVPATVQRRDIAASVCAEPSFFPRNHRSHAWSRPMAARGNRTSTPTSSSWATASTTFTPSGRWAGAIAPALPSTSALRWVVRWTVWSSTPAAPILRGRSW